MIQHEFGHGYAYYINGNDYNSWNSTYKENWADWYDNWSYRKEAGIPYSDYDLSYMVKTWGLIRNIVDFAIPPGISGLYHMIIGPYNSSGHNPD